MPNLAEALSLADHIEFSAALFLVTFSHILPRKGEAGLD